VYKLSQCHVALQICLYLSVSALSRSTSAFIVISFAFHPASLRAALAMAFARRSSSSVFSRCCLSACGSATARPQCSTFGKQASIAHSHPTCIIVEVPMDDLQRLQLPGAATAGHCLFCMQAVDLA
jgi:hypothetical protein